MKYSKQFNSTRVSRELEPMKGDLIEKKKERKKEIALIKCKQKDDFIMQALCIQPSCLKITKECISF